MPWANITIDREPSEREKRQVIDYLRRKAKPRFYADENFPERAIAVLKRLGADVLSVRDTHRRGHPDENHAAEALRLGRVLITCDRDYLDERRFPLIHCPAIVVCDLGAGTAAEIRKTFDCLINVFRAPQFFDKWTKIDARRDSWTEHVRHLDGTTSRARCRLYRNRIQEWTNATRYA